MPRHESAVRSTLATLSLLLAGGALAVSCGGGSGATTANDEGPPSIFTTFYPTTWMAEVIVGEHCTVTCPLPAGEDPITWKPEREVIARYQGADLIVTNGAALEKWLDHASLPSSRMVASAASFEAEWLTFEGTVTHRHGDGEEHTHTGIDGHTWLDPLLARAQAEGIHAAVRERWPEHAATFDAGLAEVRGALARVDQAAKGVTTALGEGVLLASHPAYDYLARRYGWRIRNFDLDPEVPLGDLALKGLEAAVQETGARVLLWESPPLAETATGLEEALGLTSVVLSPAENPGPGEAERGLDVLLIEGLGALETALAQ